VAFARNVFINCPFDEPYRALLQPLLFTVYALGFEPRIALESFDSGRPRIDKIIALIKTSKYAIHDISRLRATAVGQYFRLNMPFELGMDVGCRLFGPDRCRDKRCLVLEAEKYRYRAALSDLSGSDIAVHENKPENVVAEVRHWLNGHVKRPAASPSQVWATFNEFVADNDLALRRRGFGRQDIRKLPVSELMRYMKDWVGAQP
jgi:hypothetical protein